jgi:hypothetical protein
MNYRGGWAATEQYYANDVVISPIDNKTYILTGKMILLDGGDPSTNADWEAISSSEQLQSVTAEQATGIWNIGNSQNVILTNTGVISVETDVKDGLENIGTAQNQVLVNSGVISISTDPGSGISISGSTNNPVLTNTGVLTVAATGNCVNVGTLTAPIIEITGTVLTCAAEPVPINGGMDVSGTTNALFSWAPLATGTVTITYPAFTAEVDIPYTLTPNTVIALSGYADLSTSDDYDASNPSWGASVIPTQFVISASYLTINVTNKVKWALLAV